MAVGYNEERYPYERFLPNVILEGLNRKSNLDSAWVDATGNRAAGAFVGATLAFFSDETRVKAKGAAVTSGKILDGVDDYVQGSYLNTAASGSDLISNITYDLWFKTGSTAQQVLLGNRTTDNPSFSSQAGIILGLSFSPSGASGWVDISYRSFGGNVSGITFENINIYNTDTNLVISYSSTPGIAGTYNLYLNGSFITGGAALGSVPTDYYTQTVRLGASRFVPTRPFNGTIYRFATFAKTFTAEEVAENYRINSRKYGF